MDHIKEVSVQTRRAFDNPVLRPVLLVVWVFPSVIAGIVGNVVRSMPLVLAVVTGICFGLGYGVPVVAHALFWIAFVLMLYTIPFLFDDKFWLDARAAFGALVLWMLTLTLGYTLRYGLIIDIPSMNFPGITIVVPHL